MNKTEHTGIFEERRGRYLQLYTKNAAPGKKVYGEKLITKDNIEFREWETEKSKLAAAIIKGVKHIKIEKDDTILYLGASTGTTVSHVSDILTHGFIFALDFAPRVVRDLVFVAQDRNNIAPILGDANKPDTYETRVTQVDLVYQDIAQKQQAEIFIKNVEKFLKPKGLAILAVKARSIDVAAKPKQIFNKVKDQLKEKVELLDQITLEPFQKDHIFFVCRKR
jgi:fibrillarin-like pre-rRNA processing protein